MNPLSGAAAEAAFREQLNADARLQPGEWGWWRVWGATPSYLRAGDIYVSKCVGEPDDLRIEYIEDTFEANSAPLRVGVVVNGGHRITIGAGFPGGMVFRWGTKNTLT